MIDPKEARVLLDAGANEELLCQVTPGEMAAAWCRYAGRSRKVEGALHWEADADGWAAELCHESEFLENEAFLRSFLAALAEAAPDDLLGWVGAGPLEEFVAEDAERLAWIEAQAARSERFRRALANVWVASSVSDETLRRLETAAGTPLR